MVRPTHSRSTSATRRLTARVEVNRQEFTFRLLSRRLALGPDVTVDYYWMDSSEFRNLRTRRASDPANFRNCIGLWWAAMRECGYDRDPHEIRHLLLATSHGLTAGSKRLQNAYRDAYLAPGRTRPTEDALPDDTRDAITEVVRSRDPERVRPAFDAALGQPPPPIKMMRPLQMMFDGFLNHGVELLRDRGADGLLESVGKLDGWGKETRKKGGRTLRRTFLNLFAYEAKVRFYTCYANTWVALVPWLRRHQGLDPVSERFLGVWHMQAQPVRQPDGRTTPDVFSGQVLSLHPLSGFLMKDPALCAVAGRFFGTDAYDRVFSRGEGTNPEYWDLVGAILTAAHLYRRALDAQADGRKTRTRADGGDAATAGGDHRSQLDLLSEYLAAAGVRCPTCQATPRVTGFCPDEMTCRLNLDCPRGHTTVYPITEDEMTDWFRADR